MGVKAEAGKFYFRCDDLRATITNECCADRRQRSRGREEKAGGPGMLWVCVSGAASPAPTWRGNFLPIVCRPNK